MQLARAPVPPTGRLAPQRPDPQPLARRRQMRPLPARHRQTARPIRRPQAPQLRIRRNRARLPRTALRTRRLRDRLRPMGHRTQQRPLDRLRHNARPRVARNLQRLPMAAHHLLRLTTPALLIKELQLVRLERANLARLFFSRPGIIFRISAWLGDSPCFHTRFELPWSPLQPPSRIRSILPKIQMFQCASLSQTTRIKSDSGCVSDLACGYREPPIVGNIPSINTHGDARR